MKDFWELLNDVLSKFNIELSGWLAALALLVYILRKRLESTADRTIDWVAAAIGGAWSVWRFEPLYRRLLAANHTHMRLVGIRTEEDRAPAISDAYVPLRLLPKGATIDAAVAIEQIVDEHNHCLILGDPGAGKTTLLKYLINQSSRIKVPAKRPYSRLLVSFSRKPKNFIPFYIPLRSCANDTSTLSDTLASPEIQLLPTDVARTMPKHFVKNCLKIDRALFLLDGLDEVPDENAYDAIVRKIDDLCALYPRSKVVVTCRKAGWRGGLLPDFHVATTLSLASDQQYDFVHKWYAALAKYESRAPTNSAAGVIAASEANDLLSLIRDRERIRELASNPMLLSLICLVHKQKTYLPRGRAELYEDCIEIMLGKWDRLDKHLTQGFPTIEQKRMLLRRIAYRMHTTGLKEADREDLEHWVADFLPEVTTKSTPTDIVRQIEVRSGLISERSIDKLAFSHLTFQEFLVVDHLRHGQGDRLDLDAITDWSAWREPVLLACGTKGVDSNAIITKLSYLNPLLGLDAVYEADPEVLDHCLAEKIVTSVMTMIERREIADREAIPGLVNVLSAGHDGLQDRILTFLRSRVEAYTPEEASGLVEALSNSPTRAAARALLSFAPEYKVKSLDHVLISGLIRIGDPAIYETLQAVDGDLVPREYAFGLLTGSDTPLAIRQLWERYHLEPPSGLEYEWASAWALRLAGPNADDALRDVTVTPSPKVDGLFWPYGATRPPVVTSLVNRITAVLTNHFRGSLLQIVMEIDVVSRFSLRVLIPFLLVIWKDAFRSLLDQLRHYDESNIVGEWQLARFGSEWRRAEAIVFRMAEALYLPSQFVSPLPLGLRHKFSPYSQPMRLLALSRRYFAGLHEDYWKTLGAFLKRSKSRAEVLIKAVLYLSGLSVLIAVSVTFTLGLRALLPPEGSYSGFWNWLPVWAQIALPLLLLALPAMVLIKLKDWGVCLALLVALLVLVACPIVYPVFFIFLGWPRVIESMVSARRIQWSHVVFAVVFGLVYAVIGIFAPLPWPATMHPIASGVILAVVAILGTYAVGRGGAFYQNPFAQWLGHHPRGKEVLREFSGQDEGTR